MNNKIIEIQEMLMREMRRLDDDKTMEKDAITEIARSNALSNQATTYIKAVNTTLRVMETASKNNQTKESLTKQLGLDND